ncbi:hypothetical protein LCGC14_2675980, partial [marine sediment metagenome]
AQHCRESNPSRSPLCHSPSGQIPWLPMYSIHRQPMHQGPGGFSLGRHGQPAGVRACPIPQTGGPKRPDGRKKMHLAVRKMPTFFRPFGAMLLTPTVPGAHAPGQCYSAKSRGASGRSTSSFRPSGPMEAGQFELLVVCDLFVICRLRFAASPSIQARCPRHFPRPTRFIVGGGGI